MVSESVVGDKAYDILRSGQVESIEAVIIKNRPGHVQMNVMNSTVEPNGLIAAEFEFKLFRGVHVGPFGTWRTRVDRQSVQLVGREDCGVDCDVGGVAVGAEQGAVE